MPASSTALYGSDSVSTAPHTKRRALSTNHRVDHLCPRNSRLRYYAESALCIDTSHSRRRVGNAEHTPLYATTEALTGQSPNELCSRIVKMQSRSLSPAPSETANVFGWDGDATPAAVGSRDATPTAQHARASSPASPRAKGGKAAKGKAKATKAAPAETEVVAPAETEAHTSDNDDPFLVAELERAKAASLDLISSVDLSIEGASTSRHPAGARSPSKRLRSNTVGDAAPAPYAAVAASPVVSTSADSAAMPMATPDAGAPVTIGNPIVASAAIPVVTRVAVPALAPVAPAAVPDAVPAAAPAAAPAAGPAVMLAVWPTADGMPPRGLYTQIPVDLEDIVYSPEQQRRGVPVELVRMYDDVPHPKFFVIVSGGNGPMMRTHGRIRDAIGNFINMDPTAFILGTPPIAADGTSPSLWLVAGIPDHLAQAILDARILSTAIITLFPLPYDMPVNGYIGVFSGFTLPNTNAGANVARDLLRTAIGANTQIAQFVQTHHDALGPHVSAEQAWDTFLVSVRVEGIALIVNDTNTVAWRLYVASPTNNRDFFAQLRRLFGRVQVMTALHGTAQLQRDFRCRLCPSITHPTPLCPLPALPGWLGPTPATIAALEDVSRQAANKAWDQMHFSTGGGAGGSNSHPGSGRNQGPSGPKPRGDAKGKKGDFKGKGKRREREHDDYL
ncbi:hypothetical protein B0H13DRAFT_2344496 [Mycena leptocephala]|nr:hypothetical protein B0H13DRAFT_2344496 [Mycena leptocephala]